MFGACKVVAVKPYAEGQEGFVHINVSDFDPAVHEPFSDEDAAMLIALKAPARGAVEERSQLDREIHEGLKAERAELDKHAHEQALEGKRLTELSAELEAKKDGLDKLKATLDEERIALEAERVKLAAAAKQDMTANEIKAELTKRGISFKTNDSKAELQALLDAAPAT